MLRSIAIYPVEGPQYFDSCLSQSHHKKWSGINPKNITSVQVKPRSGSAILWYNFLATGRGDRNALHAACPVGKNETKWSVNKQLGVGFWNGPCDTNMAEKYAMKIDADEFILQLLYAGTFSQPMLVSRRVLWIFSFLFPRLHQPASHQLTVWFRSIFTYRKV